MRWITFILLFLGFFGFAQNTSVITQLPTSLEETSGLLKLNNRYYTFNDSGNANELYEFDTSNGSIVRTITINNATNVDWEAIAVDNTHVYLGDIGNNAGDRTNLRIYKFTINELENNNSISATTIDYTYNDQVDFTANPFNTDFDAEALIATSSNLYIFTKNWVNQQSNIYQLNKTSSSQTATNVGSLTTNGLVTDAYYDATDQEITFCGYTASDAYIWRLTNYSGTDFTTGQLDQFTLTIPSANSPQIEGITEASEDVFYVSAELLVTRVPTLYSVDFDTLDTPSLELSELRVFPNPANTVAYISQEAIYNLYDVTGSLVLSGQGKQINTSSLAGGIYILKLQSIVDNRLKTIKLLKGVY